MRKSFLNIGLFFAIACLIISYNSRSKENIDYWIDRLISQMTLEEKVGQMTQIILDAIGNGKELFESKIYFSIDTARLRKVLIEYRVGSIHNTTNNYALV